MESVPLEMGDLFDSEAVGEDDDDLGAQQAPLPGFEDGDEDGPMREDGEGGDTQNDEDGVIENLQRLAKGAAKKRVLRPQPKLDPERLKTNRGLPILPRLFEGVKFKGRGHENDDLRLMMGKLEHWAHRLFPKMPFDDFADRMEKLGTKKAVQTCMTKIRLDMPLLDDEFVSQHDGEQEVVQHDDDGVTMDAGTKEGDSDIDDAFEEMMRQEREMAALRKAAASTDGDSVGDSCGDGQPGGSTMPSSQGPGHELSSPQALSQSDTTTKVVTPDARARMEENRRKALERRARRLGNSLAFTPSQSNTQPGTQTQSQADTQSQSQPGTQTQSQADTQTQSQADTQTPSQADTHPPSQPDTQAPSQPDTAVNKADHLTEREILDDLLGESDGEEGL